MKQAATDEEKSNIGGICGGNIFSGPDAEADECETNTLAISATAPMIGGCVIDDRRYGACAD